MTVGEEQFYRDFLWTPRRRRSLEKCAHPAVRVRQGRRADRSGEKVPDVGCRSACFARYVEDAVSVGLEQNVTAMSIDVWSKTVAQHAMARVGA